MFGLIPSLYSSDIKRWFRSKGKSLTLREGYEDYCWSSGGAEALAMICKHVAESKKQRINVYLPGYFCGQSLRYLRSLPIKLCFYPLDAALLPDYAEIKASHKDFSVDILVHVHYFGSTAGQKTSRNLANDLNATLIEDCAHVISPYALTDWKGDYLVFSPHKHFPLPKIALVISKSSRGITKPQNAGIFPISWFLKQIFKKVRFARSPTQWGKVWSEKSEDLKFIGSHLLTQKVTSNYLCDFKNSADQRTLNTTALLNHFSVISGWRPLQEFKKITSPYLVGMVCESEEIARRRFNIINEKSQFVMQWPDLPFEIKNTNVEGESCLLVDRTLFLFNHQQIDPDCLLNEIVKLTKRKGF